MTRSSSVENLLPQFVWTQLSTICSTNSTEAAQWAAPSCSRPTMYNSVIDGRFKWLTISPTLYRAVPPEHYLHGANSCHKSQVLSGGRARVTFWTVGYRIACAATQSMNGSLSGLTFIWSIHIGLPWTHNILINEYIILIKDIAVIGNTLSTRSMEIFWYSPHHFWKHLFIFF